MAKPKPKFKTPYSRAWDKWTATDDARRCRNTYAHNLAQTFLDNRLKAAFAAGWAAHESLHPSTEDKSEQGR